MAGKGFNQWSTARRLVLVVIMLLMEVRGCAWAWIWEGVSLVDGRLDWSSCIIIIHLTNHCPTSTQPNRAW